MVTEFGADTLPGAHKRPPEMWTEEYQLEFLRNFFDLAENARSCPACMFGPAPILDGAGDHARGDDEPQRLVHARPPTENAHVLPYFKFPAVSLLESSSWLP